MEIKGLSRQDDTISMEALVDSDDHIFIGAEIVLQNETSYTRAVIDSYTVSREYAWGEETGRLHVFMTLVDKKTKYN